MDRGYYTLYMTKMSCSQKTSISLLGNAEQLDHKFVTKRTSEKETVVIAGSSNSLVSNSIQRQKNRNFMPISVRHEIYLKNEGNNNGNKAQKLRTL